MSVNLPAPSGKINDTSLDTLAQLGTSSSEDPKEGLFNFTEKTDLADLSALQKRARSKYLTTAVALRLVDLQSPLKKQYWNTFHCCSTLHKQGDKVTGEYCKNRWCLVCNRIRTAELINKYHPTLSTWEDRHFVTLTLPNVKGQFLKATMDFMLKEFNAIKDTMKKRDQRGLGSKLIGVRKLECTYNPNRNDYHPHFHIVTRDKVMAETLLDEWLKRNPSCSRLAQDLRPATEGDLIELFKYFTKLVSKSRKDDKRSIHPESCDLIFQAIRSRRTFQPFGFVLTPIPEQQDEQSLSTGEIDQAAQEEIFFEWHQTFHDWISDHGELLSDYTPRDKMKNLVSKI
jgi:plasmid rolling circle replication initiator protein Rep